MTGKKITDFQKIANRKGWTFEAIGNRWGVSERQMSRIADSGKQRDIDAVNGLPEKRGDVMHELARYLNLTAEQVEDMDIELQEDTGSSGEMVYSYFFNVPESTPEEVLVEKEWEVGDLVTGIPLSVVESYEEIEPENMDFKKELNEFNQLLADYLQSYFPDAINAFQTDDNEETLLFRGPIPNSDVEDREGTHVSVTLDMEVKETISSAESVKRSEMMENLKRNLGSQIKCKYKRNYVGQYAEQFRGTMAILKAYEDDELE